jgi:hypothetical protein
MQPGSVFRSGGRLGVKVESRVGVPMLIAMKRLCGVGVAHEHSPKPLYIVHYPICTPNEAAQNE